MTDGSSAIACALTIAGSDSGGGAGIQADLKTFSACGVYGASVLTAVTAQNTCAVTAVETLSPAMVSEQMRAVFDDIRFGAIKIGMLASTPIIAAVADGLAASVAPIVLDPVMVAKSGDHLLESSAVDALRDQLVPHASVLTPNLPEAATLLGEREVSDEAGMARQGRALLALGPGAVLMKGGHADQPDCVDLLVTADAEPLRLSAPRIRTRNTHGTGCTLSAAIAARLARGDSLADAVRNAHGYLQGAIAAADQLHVGRGAGPVHHFHALWG